MPLFRCQKCGCVENTALSNYWTRKGDPAICSECDPQIGEWHGRFAKKPADGYVQDRQGFIYSPAEVDQCKHMGPFTPLTPEAPADGR